MQPGNFDVTDLASTKGHFALPTDPSLPNVQFQPDGTADPAVFVLTAPTSDDKQEDLQYWVVLDGITGLCKVREPPTAKQFDSMVALRDALPDLKFQEQTVEITQDQQEGEQTLAGMLSGAAGGASSLSDSDLQQILSQIFSRC